MKNILEIFINKIKEVFKENLKSVVLYGSRASGEEVKKYSDYNLLIILNEIKLYDLKIFAKPVKNWRKYGNPVPLIFTGSSFKKSADVFPIEFLEMKEHNKILYGNNPFEGLNIEYKNLRHEIEFELKSKLLKLREGYILTDGKQDKIRGLLVSSISTFLTLFREVIRLKLENPPSKRIDALMKISELTGINTSSFILILKMKENIKEPKKPVPETIFEEYIGEIEKVIDFIDNIST